MNTPTGILEFEGPPTAYCFGRTYETLTSVGIRRQGQPYPGVGAEVEVDAWLAFDEQLAAYKAGATQIAWRSKPEAIVQKGMWFVTCRLAAFP